ncbi:SCO family protein [Vibrio mimicus]|nr:SCO family protein [Vibrio mimicus]QXC55318.1 SCO family protein [Vibrio mimicus]
MSKNWSLILVVAFTLGFGVKAYLDSQQKLTNTTPTSLALFGQNQQPVQLFDQTDPRIRIVYFGFTRCPDVCPTSLAMLSAALNQVDDKAKSQLRPMFISLDPERDDAKLAAQYAHYFHPMIEGASGSLETTQQLAKKYGVIFRKTELPNSELKYTLDHSSYFYFLQPDGTLIDKVPHTQDPAPIVETIQKIVNSKG